MSSPRVSLDDFGGQAAAAPTATVVDLESFVAVVEPGVDALVGTSDDALIPTSSDVMPA